MKYKTKRYKTVLEFDDLVERQTFLSYVISNTMGYKNVNNYKVIICSPNETDYQKILAWLFNREMPSSDEIKEIEGRVGDDYKLYSDCKEGIIRI